MSTDPNESNSSRPTNEAETRRPDESRLHSLECLQFVRAAIDLTARDTELAAKGHVTAEGVCRVLLEMSVDEFGAEGKQVLIEWGIERSEDVGLIVYRLLKAGYVKAVVDDPIEKFECLFDLNQSVESWKIKW